LFDENRKCDANPAEKFTRLDNYCRIIIITRRVVTRIEKKTFTLPTMTGVAVVAQV
jgi:hypothetical protein